MYRRSLVAAALALTAACAGTTPVASTAGELEAPLAARLLSPDYGVLRFSTSRPAYVAVFEVIPGRGSALIYPTAGWQDGRVDGYTQAHLAGYIPGRDYYSNTYLTRFGQLEPRYLYMIASERPLRLERLQSSPSSLYRQLGYSRFIGSSFSQTAREIARAVVPQYDSEDWVTDYYMIVPDARTPIRSASVVAIRCADGSVRYVNPDFVIPNMAAGAFCPALPDTTTRRDTIVAPGDSGRSKLRKPEAGEAEQSKLVRPGGKVGVSALRTLDEDETERLTRDVFNVKGDEAREIRNVKQLREREREIDRMRAADAARPERRGPSPDRASPAERRSPPSEGKLAAPRPDRAEPRAARPEPRPAPTKGESIRKDPERR
jgi:hypothetical protein